MQSGTPLHLALLRKLSSSRQPRKFNGSRFSRFRSRDTSLSQRAYTPQKSLEKYASCEAVFNFVRKSEVPKRGRREEKEVRVSVTGWSLQDEQVCNYEQKIKKSKYSFFDNQISKFKKSVEKRDLYKKFTFCEDNIDYFATKSLKKCQQNNKQFKSPLVQTNKTISPFVILDTQTQKKPVLPPTGHVLINKQNLCHAEFQLISPSLPPRKNIRSNQKFRVNHSAMKNQRQKFKYSLIC